MRTAAQAFEDHRGGPNIRAVPPAPKPDSSAPYSSLQVGDIPPMMFQLRLKDGRWLSFCYSDIRQMECRDSGCLELIVGAARNTTIRLEGRHLRELASLLGMALIRWIQEADSRCSKRSEEEAEIINITVETDQ